MRPLVVVDSAPPTHTDVAWMAGATSYSRVKSYACPSSKIRRSTLSLPSLSIWNRAKAIGAGPRFVATAENLSAGTSLAENVPPSHGSAGNSLLLLPGKAALWIVAHHRLYLSP